MQDTQTDRFRQTATDTDRHLALIYVLLSEEPATLGVVHALGLIDGLLPLGGTKGRREAFAWAHEQRAA
jgi:hypothetical protein